MPRVCAPGVEVFVSYCHQDETLCNELIKHLAVFERDGTISVWHDRKIVPGKEWEGIIDSRINSADVILLLISPDFMASQYCFDVELKRAMERHRSGEARVVPIILRPVEWRDAQFAHLQALPKDGKPVSQWRSHDAAFTSVAQGLRLLINEVRSSRAVRGDSGCRPRHPSSNAGGEPERLGTEIEGESLDIELRIDADFDRYSDEQQQLLLDAIGKLLKTNADLKVVRKRRGSLKLTVRVKTPDSSALERAVDELGNAIERGRLKRFGVRGAYVPGDLCFVSRRYFSWRSYVDRVLALLFLIPAAPIIFLLAALIRLTSGAPAMFRVSRVGQYGRIFTMYKLRTMAPRAEVRITRTALGRALEFLNLDDLPQLFNVLRGDMGLIGPRPEHPKFTEPLLKVVPGYEQRLVVPPGITGLAQINLPPDSDLDSVRCRLTLDLEYIQTTGPWLDFRIGLCHTFRMVGIRGGFLRRCFGVWRQPGLPIHGTGTPESPPTDA